RRDAVGPVVLVEVDVLHAQPTQRRVDRLADVRPRAACSRAVPHVAAELRREQDAVAPALEHAPEQLLTAPAVAVDVGGVEEADALVERRVDDRTRLLQADAAADVVAAEADDGDLRPAFTEPARTHRRAW